MAEQKINPNQIPIEVRTLIEARLTNEKKSALVAYLLLIFFGLLGLHLFYLGRFLQGFFYLICTLCFWAFPPILIIPTIGCIIDLFLIPHFIQVNLAQKRRSMEYNYLHTGHI